MVATDVEYISGGSCSLLQFVILIDLTSVSPSLPKNVAGVLLVLNLEDLYFEAEECCSQLRLAVSELRLGRLDVEDLEKYGLYFDVLWWFGPAVEDHFRFPQDRRSARFWGVGGKGFL